MNLTDAIVYKGIASEIGELPPQVTDSAVTFYSLTLDASRRADAAPTAQAAYEMILGLAPRVKMYAALLIKTLDKLEAANFDTTADIRPTRDEVRQLAREVGYPLDEVLKERGYPA
jgi:hypothetical protein